MKKTLIIFTLLVVTVGCVSPRKSVENQVIGKSYQPDALPKATENRFTEELIETPQMSEDEMGDISYISFEDISNCKNIGDIIYELKKMRKYETI